MFFLAVDCEDKEVDEKSEKREKVDLLRLFSTHEGELNERLI